MKKWRYLILLAVMVFVFIASQLIPANRVAEPNIGTLPVPCIEPPK